MLSVSAAVQSVAFGQSNAAHQAVKDNMLSGDGAPGQVKAAPVAGPTQLFGSEAVQELRDANQAASLAEKRVVENLRQSTAPQPKPESLSLIEPAGEQEVSSKSALDDLARVIAKADADARNQAFGIKVKVEALSDPGPNFDKAVDSVRSMADPTGGAGESRLI